MCVRMAKNKQSNVRSAVCKRVSGGCRCESFNQAQRGRSSGGLMVTIRLVRFVLVRVNYFPSPLLGCDTIIDLFYKAIIVYWQTLIIAYCRFLL